jgi:hypothetical protein
MEPLFALRNYMLFSDLDEKHSSGSSFGSIIVITGLWRETFSLGCFSQGKFQKQYWWTI